ncbi:sulfite exporter TauE/SafE family protein [Marinobacterium sp. YM272]|uniref:sulfite exporter TauE/SafE family protein n=1 Tax=Marinobacterium sp. YM272 TaxID=3421654 RepID=UPI003D7F76FB
MQLTTSSEILQNIGSTPFLIACLAAMCVGMAKGGVPTVGMLAVPVISLAVSPIKGAAILLPIFILTDMVSVWLYRRSFSKPNLKILIPAGLMGVVVGWATASLISDQVVSILIGSLGIAFCCYTWFGKTYLMTPKQPTFGRGILWGGLAGFTSFISHAGSPPYQIYVIPQRLEKLTFVGTTAVVFAAINLAKVIPYANLRPYSPEDLTLALWLIPTALAGTFLGVFLIKRLADAWFSRLIQVGLLLVSIKLILQAV